MTDSTRVPDPDRELRRVVREENHRPKVGGFDRFQMPVILAPFPLTTFEAVRESVTPGAEVRS